MRVVGTTLFSRAVDRRFRSAKIAFIMGSFTETTRSKGMLAHVASTSHEICDRTDISYFSSFMLLFGSCSHSRPPEEQILQMLFSICNHTVSAAKVPHGHC